jgi:hypothetical protein
MPLAYCDNIHLHDGVIQAFGCCWPIFAGNGLDERKMMTELFDGGGGVKR